jgi:prepilin signal peptidase PulO-like enzyme (type II secretory pathway)
MNQAAIAPFVGVYMVLVALMLGSFINLAADRLPRKESLLRPRSHCRSCGRQLNAIDLLPIAGYLLRRGRCASCGVPIGAASLLVEAVSGGCMIAALALWGPWTGAVAGIALVGAWGLLVTGVSLLRRSARGAGALDA